MDNASGFVGFRPHLLPGLDSEELVHQDGYLVEGQEGLQDVLVRTGHGALVGLEVEFGQLLVLLEPSARDRRDGVAVSLPPRSTGDAKAFALDEKHSCHGGVPPPAFCPPCLLHRLPIRIRPAQAAAAARNS